MVSKISYEDDAWGTSTTTNASESNSTKIEVEITPAQVVQKENLIQEIKSSQEGLTALLERLTQVQSEGTKLRSNNAMLQTYIDNLTRNNALIAGASAGK